MTLDTINVKTDYENYQHLVQTQGLVPNQRVAGEFTKVKKGLVKDKMRFLFPSNWIFHDQIVEKVLEGDYFGIMPYCAEFVTTMNCSNRCEIPCGYKLQKIMEEVWEKNNSQNPRVHMQNIEFAKNLLDRLINGGVKGMIFTGGGEPFLFKGLEDLVARASEQGVDSVVYTNGNYPVGNGIGPILEMQDVLSVLQNLKETPEDLREKSLFLATELIKLCGIKDARKKAEEALSSGKAYEKFKEIINAQNGKNNFDLKVQGLKLGKFKKTIKANKTGRITEVNNKGINSLCRVLGTPETISAGVYLHKQRGKIAKGESLITLYSESKSKLKDGLKYLKETKPIAIK